MERWQNRVAVVTGASSGIGSATVIDLVKAGLVVVGLARRQHRVEELRSTLPPPLQKRLHVVQCDVSDLNSVNKAFQWIEQHLGGISVLVNNAGTYTSGQLLTMEVGILEQTIQTNIMGVIYCTRKTVDSMQKHKLEGGHVVLINSIVGHSVFNPPPGAESKFNIYPPSKHAVTGLTEILRQEFRDLKSKIRVTVSCAIKKFHLFNKEICIDFTEHKSRLDGHRNCTG